VRRSVDSEPGSRVIELRKSIRGSLHRSLNGGHAAAARSASRGSVPPESKSTCKQAIGVSQELGRSCLLHGYERLLRGGRAVSETPRACGLGISSHKGANRRCDRGTAQRRKPRAAGWEAGSRSILIVPQKRGNSTRGDPVEGSGMPDHGTVIGQYGGCIEIRTTYQRNNNG